MSVKEYDPATTFPGVIGRTVEESTPAWPRPIRAKSGMPNVLFIVLDDTGYGHLGCYGSPIRTPNLDRLAANGLRYSNMHTTALCSPSRSCMLTGRNHHSVGMGVITELADAYPGYSGQIPKSAAMVSEILRQNGYATAWIGKNHNTPIWETSEIGPFDRWANGLGFEYFYGFNAGDTSQYEPILYENRNRVPRSSDPNYHLSTDIADKSIAWMQKVKVIDPERPFFLYVAPAATHSPHQAPKQWIDKFKGQFDMGWDRYREITFERQQQLGVVPSNAKLTPRPAGLPAWETLNAEQKRLYARMMEVFAGYGAHVDHEVGRVLDAVAKLPDAANTMIIYIVGDNGASAEGGIEGSINENAFFNNISETWQDNIKVIDELGGPKHFNHFPSAWAWAMDTPFQWTKQVASHFGGTRNPMLISWPAKILEKGGLRSQFHHVIDIMPTILEVAGVQAPDTLNGVAQKPIEGVSIAYTFGDRTAPERHKAQVFEIGVNRGIYQNGWFASSLSFPPWQPDRTSFDIDKAKWELYNIDQDFSQADDLAASNPGKLRALQDLWWAEAARNNILPLDWRGPERLSAELTGKPSLAAERTKFVYETPLAALPEAAAPDLKNKSFTITAEAEIPPTGAEGMIFTQGGFTGGWGFFMQQGKLIGLHNHVALESYRVASTEPVPVGKVALAMDFQYDGGGIAKGGTITLLANGRKIGEGRIEKTTPFKYSLFEGQDIGEDAGSPIDFSYAPPFPFTGKLGRVTIELKPKAASGGRALQ